MFERLVLGAPQWVWPALAIAGAGIVVVAYVYARAGTAGAVRVAAAMAKITAVLLLAACLLDPLWSGRRPRPQANVVAVLVDNSQSMTIRSTDERRPRNELLRGLVDQDAGWRKRLEQDFDVREYAFDSRLQGGARMDQLDFTGDSSALHAALHTLGERFKNRATAGLLVFTDGNATDEKMAQHDWESLGFPVFPVLPPPAEELRDVRIGGIVTSQSDFETTPVTIDVQIAATGMAGTPLTVQLRDAENKLVEEATVDAPGDDQSATVRFRFRPDKIGVQFYQVTAVTRREQDQFEAGRGVREATAENNRQWLAVHRRRGPYRVLYVAGRPNWEFKFLRRALQEDTEIELVGLIRIAKESPKFTFQDRSVGSANPLFQGFSPAEEEAGEQREEPVLLRVGVASKEELQTGFPTSAAELFRYDAVVLDDIEAAFFTQDQLLLLRRFVSDRGGGLLLLGGPDSFADGGYGASALAEMAPAYAAADLAAQPREPAALRLTRDGLLQPWMRLRSTEDSERERMRQMPTFSTWNPVQRIKPGATIMASLVDSSQREHPGIVVQRFGHGRCATVLAGDMWRWAMRRQKDQPHDLAQAWRQTIRWLTSDVPRRVQVEVASEAAPDQPVVVRVAVRDEEFQPLDNSDMHLSITPPGGEPFRLAMVSSTEAAGTYTASYWPDQTGGYRAKVQVKAADGSDVGQAEAGWVSNPAAAEYRQLVPNRAALEQLARDTGGEVLQEDALDDFVADLPKRSVPITEHWVYPLWHHPWVVALVALCLCAEWGLRRWKGLP